MKRAEIAAAVERERLKLVQDLRGLSEDAWDAQSLCEDWRVRDVVGHLIRLGEWNRRPHQVARDVLGSPFCFNRALSDAARRVGRRPPDQLLELLANSRYEKTLGFRIHPQPLFALAEWVVHGQDIRRPLGLPRSFDTDALKAVADVSTKWYTWGGRQRRRPERFEATDADWETGQGPPTLRGPLEAIVMVLFARDAALVDLEPHSSTR